MVATRNHPKEFPDPETAVAESSPRKRTTRTSTANHASPTKPAAASPPPTPTRVTRTISTRSMAQSTNKAWSHTPSNMTLIWLVASLPLVLWDSGYVMFRPHSMPGGSMSWFWYPYGGYGEIDKVYGFKAWDAHNGWTLTQTIGNLFETAVYVVYLYLVYKYGEQETTQGTGAPDKSKMGRFSALSESRTVHGRIAALATLLAYTAAVVTTWKTVIYWLLEACEGFANLGHNSWPVLLFYWGPLNGAWIVYPGYMSYVYGKEILDGLVMATQDKKTR